MTTRGTLKKSTMRMRIDPGRLSKSKMRMTTIIDDEESGVKNENGDDM